MRNVTVETQVGTGEKYTSVHKQGFVKASQGGGWAMTAIIAPIGLVWGLILSLAKAAGGLLGLGLIFLSAYFSVDNFHLLMFRSPISTSFFGFWRYPNFLLFFGAIALAGLVELWQSKGFAELKRAKVLKKTGSGKPNYLKIVLGLLATLAEFLSLVSSFWLRGGAADPRNWVIILLVIFGLKVGYAMVTEYSKERKQQTVEA